MGFGIWDTPSGRDRRWERRKSGFAPAPTYVRVAVVALATTLVATLVWQGAKRLLDPAKMAGSEAPHFYVTPPSDRPGVAAWQTSLSDALEQAVTQGVGGNITAAEMQTDRAATILMTARMRSEPAAPDFFDRTVRKLDRVLQSHPENERLIEHVTQARIELAQLRSAQPVVAEGTGGEVGAAKNGGVAEAGSASPASLAMNVGPDARAPHAVNIPGHVVLAAPRGLSANELLNSAALAGNYIDATLMPDTSEILLPPSTRVMADGVRVDGLTIAGAAQTLDGIRWKDVTFVGTRLRYEGGEVSLQNVRFTNCTFGFSTNDRGARLADAIALGQRTFVMQ
jgi:hypothetical protein